MTPNAARSWSTLLTRLCSTLDVNAGKPYNQRMTIKRGDVYWLAPDDSRQPVPTYSHPHVVVQDDVFNESRVTTVIVCALTSNLQRASEPGNVLLDPGEANLPAQSVVVVSQ